MTLLDAYALIAFFIRGPATPQVRAILREGDAAVATANLTEVLDVSERVAATSTVGGIDYKSARIGWRIS